VEEYEPEAVPPQEPEPVPTLPRREYGAERDYGREQPTPKGRGRQWVLAVIAIVVIGGLAAWIALQKSGTAAPTILYFTASPASVEKGQTTQFAWQVRDAESVTVEPNLETVDPASNAPMSKATLPAQGEEKVLVSETTTYRLIAKGQGGTSESSFTVEVRAPAAVSAQPPPSQPPASQPPSGAETSAAGENPQATARASQLGLRLVRTKIASEDGYNRLVGRHPLFLQWLGEWEEQNKFGRAEIVDLGGTLFVKGAQRTDKGSLNVDGMITSVDRASFSFEGIIDTQVSFINNGRSCRRKGKMTFRATQGRQYWRLQEMDNPCDAATDYVDIFFTRLGAADSGAAGGAPGTQPAPQPKTDFGGGRVTAEVTSIVTAIESDSGATKIVRVDRGLDDGIPLSAQGTVYSVWKPNNPLRTEGARPLGKAQVINADSRTARVRVTLDNPSGSGNLIVGDLIDLRGSVPNHLKGTPLGETVLYNITFKANDGKTTLCDYRMLLRDGSSAQMERIYTQMVDDVRTTAREFGAVLPNTPASMGRFVGKTPRQVMLAVTREDVIAFLRFVILYPGKYMGHTWKFNEVFSTWVINGSPEK
jgi:hypothetical protein